MKKFKEDNVELLIVDTRCVHLTLCLFLRFSRSACITLISLLHSGDCTIEGLSNDVEKLFVAIVSVIVIHPKIHEKENMSKWMNTQAKGSCILITHSLR